MNGALKSVQLLIGILTGLVGLAAIFGGVGYYFFITQMSTRPPKPIFAEERGGAKPIAAKPKPKSKTAAAISSPAPAGEDPLKPDAPDKLPPESYDAKVIWKDGLSLKKDPALGAAKVGGVAFNAKVAIVKTSDDKQWVLIQSETDNLQGWVRAGNIDKAAVAASEAQDNPSVKPKAKKP
jgi:Bacterial SH3 domain